jgi:antitoxin component YwqK of YwqJK toxin-antitoxin module
MCVFFLASLNINAVSLTVSLQEAVAEKYAAWAYDMLKQNEFEKTLKFLERSKDYADVSSDISYMLAFTRNKLNKNALSALTPALLSIKTERWNLYTKTDALLLSAQIQIRLRRYNDALRLLKDCNESEESALLRILALKGALKNNDSIFESFTKELENALQRYPNNKEFTKIAFTWAAEQKASQKNSLFVQTFLEKLNLIRNVNDDVLYMAAPFFYNEEETQKQLLVWYSASNGVVPNYALPVLLNYGIVDEGIVISKLFENETIDAGVIKEVYKHLRTDLERENFRKEISGYTGVITEDYDADGYIEARTTYQNGFMTSFTLDSSQNGITNTEIIISAGTPVQVTHSTLANNVPAGDPTEGVNLISPVFQENTVQQLQITYTNYPIVTKAVLKTCDTENNKDKVLLTFYFSPNNFFHKPIDFEQLAGPFGLPFPTLINKESFYTGVKMLWAHSYEVETAGKNFKNSKLILQLKNEILLSAREYIDNTLVSEDFFTNGRLYERRIDMDLDGKLETRIRFQNLTFETPQEYLNAEL